MLVGASARNDRRKPNAIVNALIIVQNRNLKTEFTLRLFMRHLSVSPVPNLGKTLQLSQSDLTPWTLTLTHVLLFSKPGYAILPFGSTIITKKINTERAKERKRERQRESCADVTFQ